MYQRDVPKIKSYVEGKGPDGLLHVGAFVLSTIQVPLSRTGGMVSDIKLKGASSNALWGMKRNGYMYLTEHRKALYDLLCESDTTREDAVYRLLAVPSLGLPKASFLLQCLGYETACMDVHNLQRYGIDPKVTKVGDVKVDTKIKKIDRYLEICDNIGTSEYHWDTWCGYVAGNRMNKSLPTADRVSAYHYEAISNG